MAIERILVFCASSNSADPRYRADAARLGELLARAGATVVYGGGSNGSMGALAEAALASGGSVSGVIPHFMVELEWAHRGLDELKLVDDMYERKREMLRGTDAVVALPGGCGTLEELFEVITLKRLGEYTKPIILVNTNGFFDACVALLEQCVEERFMDQRHLGMWQLVRSADDVLGAIADAPEWSEEARDFAGL